MEFPKEYDRAGVEKKWQQQWTFVFDARSSRPQFSIDTPPPTLSGRMHLGHAFSYSQGDFIARYKRMRGFHVQYPFGTDDNGLPTERMIEKLKNVKATKMPRSEFIALCNTEIAALKPQFIQDWKNLAISADFAHSYSTISPSVIRTSQTSFLDLCRKGFVYRQESPTMWCTQCRTAIAQAELDDVEMQSTFNDIIFKCGGKELIIATTRPELIPACVAVLYNPEDERYKLLEGKFTTTPFGVEVPIYADPAVDREKGTGLVMCCTFGDQTDIAWWRKFNLPLKTLINANGTMTDTAGEYEGLTVNDARKKIREDLQSRNLLIRETPITHAVNVHERCGTPIEFLKTQQWFVRVLDHKQELLEAGQRIRWHPEHMGTRYAHWVQGLQWDWCISRQRPFGVPFPVWHCKCGKSVFADDAQLPVDPLHDAPGKSCKCGNTDLVPETDVMDTWATSSLTPQIVLEWTENYHEFVHHFPMSLRLQAHDIIRTWAFYTILKSWYHHKQIPWKDIAISGHALDPRGKKMSKSKGNVIDPVEVLHKHGADALRFWAASSKLGEDVPFQEKELVAGKRLMTKLWNAARFAAPHLAPYDGKPPQSLHPLDAWILSKLQHVLRESTIAFEQYDYSRTKSETEKFFWHVFCDNYLELAKDRLYNAKSYDADAVRSAQFMVASVLLTMLKMLAPILPHITEEIYHLLFVRFGGVPSVHELTWPIADQRSINPAAEAVGDAVVEILIAVRKHKSEKGLALNAPLEQLAITCSTDLSLVQADLKAATGAVQLVLSKGEFKVEF